MDKYDKMAMELAEVIKPIVWYHMGEKHVEISVDDISIDITVVKDSTWIEDVDAMFKEVHEKIAETFGETHKLSGIDVYLDDGELAFLFKKYINRE